MYINKKICLNNEKIEYIKKITKGNKKALQVFLCALIYSVRSKIHSGLTSIKIINIDNNKILENETLQVNCEFENDICFKEVLQSVTKHIMPFGFEEEYVYASVCVDDDKALFNKYVEDNFIKCGLNYNFNDGIINLYIDNNDDFISDISVEKVYNRIISEILNNLGKKISDINLLDNDEISEIASDINNNFTELNYSVLNEELADVFENQPDSTAFKCSIDLSTVYMYIEGLSDKYPKDIIENCCFSLNENLKTKFYNIDDLHGYFYQTPNENAIMVNDRANGLINLFNENHSLKEIFSFINEGLDIVIEVYSESENSQTNNYKINGIEDLIVVIKLLYRLNMIQLTGYNDCEVNLSIDSKASDVCSSQLKFLSFERLFEEGTLEKLDILLIGNSDLIYTASYLKDNNIKCSVSVVDYKKNFKKSKEEVFLLIQKHVPEFVLFTMDRYEDIATVYRISEEIRNTVPDIKVIVIGKAASLYAEDVISVESIDFVVTHNISDSVYKICCGDTENISSILCNCKEKSNHCEYEEEDIKFSDISECIPFKTSVLGDVSINCCVTRNVRSISDDIKESLLCSTNLKFKFDFDINASVKYYQQIFDNIDLSDSFGKIECIMLPDKEVIRYINSRFKYVHWILNLCSLSEKHRFLMMERNISEKQPSDAFLSEFLNQCEKYSNNDVALNFMLGMPYYDYDDIEKAEMFISTLTLRYRCIGNICCKKLFAQPGEQIINDYENYDMFSYASSYEEFLYYSELILSQNDADENDENIPYILYNDDSLNDALNHHKKIMDKRINEYISGKNRRKIIFKSYSYRQLNVYSNQLARMLKENGIKKGDKVILLCSGPFYQLISILAVIKIGGVYVPLDPQNPQERIQKIINLTQSNYILTDKTIKSSFNAKYQINLLLNEFTEYSSENILEKVLQEDSVYIIFTSGTTGMPKGVEITNKSLCNFIQWRVREYNFTKNDVTLQTLQYVFDGHYTNLYSSIMSGGQLIMLDTVHFRDYTEFSREIYNLNVTNLSTVPSIAKAIYTYACPCNFDKVRFIVLAGQKSDDSLLNLMQEYSPNVQIINEYGPTECCIAVFSNKNMNSKNLEIIGKPIWNTNAVIIDYINQLLPAGVIGEIGIVGISLAKGYIGQSGETEKSFILQEQLNKRVYKTGDLGYQLPNGDFCILGRIDNQMKINGFRIEPFEIERTILNIEGIKDCAVTSIASSDGSEQIAAYYVSESDLLKEKIMDTLKTVLPMYMLPNELIRVYSIPRNSSGKIMTGQLERIVESEGSSTVKKVREKPRNAIEREVAKVLEEVLDVSDICIDDNFFEMGGNSFNALSVVSKCNRRFNTEELFAYSTIRELYDNVLSVNLHDNRIIKELHTSEKSEYALICIPYGGGNANVYHKLAEEIYKLTDIIDVYSVKLPGHEITDDDDFCSIEEIARLVFKYIQENIKKKIIIYGHCGNGSALSIELGSLCQKNGLDVSLAFIGASLPASNSSFVLKIIGKASKLVTNESMYTRLKGLGFNIDVSDEYMNKIVKAFRFDGESATEYYLNKMKSTEETKCAFSIINVVSNNDPATKGYRTKYNLWKKYSDDVRLIEIDGGGHYFLNSKSDILAKEIVDCVKNIKADK